MFLLLNLLETFLCVFHQSVEHEWDLTHRELGDFPEVAKDRLFAEVEVLHVLRVNLCLDGLTQLLVNSLALQLPFLARHGWLEDVVSLLLDRIRFVHRPLSHRSVGDTGYTSCGSCLLLDKWQL